MNLVQSEAIVGENRNVEDATHPAGWWLSMRWHDLLFAHWPVSEKDLLPLVPQGIELDRYNGQVWLGIVPFHMTHIHARRVPPIPRLRAFAETNLRTYVTCNGNPGVFFISLDAPHFPAVITARTFFHLPYVFSKVECKQEHDWICDRTVRDKQTSFVARYRPIGPVRCSSPGSIEYFLTERYCLFAKGKREEIITAKIHHGRWPLQRAEAQIEANTLPNAYGIKLPDTKPLLHFSKYVQAVAWLPKRV